MFFYLTSTSAVFKPIKELHVFQETCITDFESLQRYIQDEGATHPPTLTEALLLIASLQAACCPPNDGRDCMVWSCGAREPGRNPWAESAMRSPPALRFLACLYMLSDRLPSKYRHSAALRGLYTRKLSFSIHAAVSLRLCGWLSPFDVSEAAHASRTASSPPRGAGKCAYFILSNLNHPLLALRP